MDLGRTLLGKTIGADSEDDANTERRPKDIESVQWKLGNPTWDSSKVNNCL